MTLILLCLIFHYSLGCLYNNNNLFTQKLVNLCEKGFAKSLSAFFKIAFRSSRFTLLTWRTRKRVSCLERKKIGKFLHNEILNWNVEWARFFCHLLLLQLLHDEGGKEGEVIWRVRRVAHRKGLYPLVQGANVLCELL